MASSTTGREKRAFRLFSPRKLFTLAIFAAIAFGWSIRSEYYITAEHGLGYALGITGVSCMVLLLMYPLRKRLSRTPILIFSTKTWFKIHMVLGILGPLAILFHSNFRLGSTNSNITLASMALMVTSGLIGRFIYTRIHYSLYGNKIQIKELYKEREAMHQKLDAQGLPDSILLDNLYAFEKKVMARRGFWGNLTNLFMLGASSRLTLRNLTKDVKAMVTDKNHLVGLDKNQRIEYFHATSSHIASYLKTLRRIALLGVYERMFSIWHMLHLPIFGMLVVTAIAHVYAVHVY